MADFTERLKNLLKENHMTLPTFRDAMEIGKNYVYEWTTGHHRPQSQYLIKIAEYFDVSVDYLMGRTDIKQKFKNDAKCNFKKNFCTLMVNDSVETLTPLLKQIGIHDTAFTSYIAGHGMRFVTVCKFADYFKVSADVVLGLVDARKEIK